QSHAFIRQIIGFCLGIALTDPQQNQQTMCNLPVYCAVNRNRCLFGALNQCSHDGSPQWLVSVAMRATSTTPLVLLRRVIMCLSWRTPVTSMTALITPYPSSK